MTTQDYRLAKKERIAFLGPEGTFSHQAAFRLFGEKNELVPCETIEDIFSKTESLTCRYGVIPVENSAQGSVTVSMDCCIQTPLKIMGELHLPVRQMLLSNAEEIASITRICSHPQPLLQCRRWLLRTCSGVTQEAVSSTAEAAKRAEQDVSIGVVGSKMLADIYSLKILASDIEDAQHNITRFWVLGPSACPMEEGVDYKTSLWFITPHKPGALFGVLQIFSETNVNIMRIESRPFPGKAWEYVFFLDLEGHQDAEHVQAALSRLSSCVEQYRVLGSYQTAQ